MNSTIKIVLNILVAIMILLGVALCVMIVSQSSGIDAEDTEAITEAAGGVIDTTMIVVFIQIGLAAVIALVAGLLFFAINIKKRMGALIGIVAFAVVGLIAYYVLADPATAGFMDSDKQAVTADTARFVSGGLHFFYVLLGLAVVAALGGELLGFVKKLAK